MRRVVALLAAGIVSTFVTLSGLPASALATDGADLVLDKTVSKTGSCPGSDMISVPLGTQVTYCYKVTNNSPITLTTHVLQDSVLGSLFGGTFYTDLGPYGGMFITSTTSTITQMTMNVATWTASITSTLVLSDTDSAKVFLCGDAVTDSPTEDCDDGNTVSSDCCSSMCMFETGACSDGDLCTLSDMCQQGVCVGTPKDCPDLDECNSGSCNTGDGSCTTVPLSGTPCVNGVSGVTCFTDMGMCDAGVCKVTAADADGDHICDSDDARPDQLDPSGYFYDENTAKIVPGGKVIISRVGGGVGVLNQTADGSAGFYQYDVSGLTATEETYALAITYPPGCFPSQTCLLQLGAFDPTGMGNPVALGNYPDAGDPTKLSSNACTPFYKTFEFESGDPHVINNNIPVVCVPTAAPMMSMRGLLALCLILGLLGLLALRRTRLSHR